tara:strand:- start:508 stop:864 length:357 start_codon:yes stop_codon:yes gene_type:complete
MTNIQEEKLSLEDHLDFFIQSRCIDQDIIYLDPTYVVLYCIKYKFSFNNFKEIIYKHKFENFETYLVITHFKKKDSKFILNMIKKHNGLGHFHLSKNNPEIYTVLPNPFSLYALLLEI